VNQVVPFYRKMEELHVSARELPRLVSWPRIAKVIDRMVMEAINTSEPVETITRRAQQDVE